MSEPGDPASQFLESAQRIGLLDAEQVLTISRETFASGNSTAPVVAAKLVEKQLLTPYQAEELLAGRGEECVLAGRYFISRKLGAGAMGAVYLAHDRKLDRTVAVKVLPSQSVPDQDAVARFQREAKAMAKLSHENIVQAYDSDQDQGRHFLAMEFVEGVNLAQFLRENGPVTPTLAADFVYQAALGLEHAHSKGLVHRDLKPSNLLLAPDHRVKILDLGLARFLQDQVGDATLTREGVGMGTPDYMAPEQFVDAHHVDGRSDIYSLGCTLYHLIAGRVPFPGSSLSEKYAAHEKKEATPLEELCPEVPAGLALVVNRMIAKRPADRFQTAREVAEALAPYVAGSSLSLRFFKETAQWEGSMLSLSVVPLRNRQRRRMVIGSIMSIASALVVALSFWAGGAFRTAPLEVTSVLAPTELTGTVSESQTEPKLPEPGDPDVLTVAKDGSGQFRTLAEAIAKVDRPDMTIRVLDSDAYEESLQIRDRDHQAGLTIESTHQAKLRIPKDARLALTIRNVPRLKIRGFVIEIDRSTTTGMGLTGYCHGTLFDGLEFRGSQVSTTGISIDSTVVDAGDVPIVVQNCKFDGVANGIEVIGQNMATNQASPLRGLVVHNNIFNGNYVGIWMLGRVNQVFVVSNRMQNFSDAGIRMAGLKEGSGQLLIANNTLRGPRHCIEITGLEQPVESIEIRNNLLAAESGIDIAALGTGTDIIQSWNINHNWRRFRKPDDADPAISNWIKPDEDTILEKIEWSSADVASRDFLSPKDLSALKSVGAGGDLPTIVGAVLPEGVEPWDWKTTWDTRHPKMLLTVSKDAKDGGDFRTINEALAKVTRPAMTVRVLDDASYDEAIMIRDRTKFQGLKLEAPKHATLVIPLTTTLGIAVVGVSDVIVRGFRVETKVSQSFCLAVGGQASAVVFDDITCAPANLGAGMTVENLPLTSTDAPVIVEHCRFIGCSTGIQVLGFVVANHRPMPSRRMVIRQNKFADCGKGIWGVGELSDLHIVGNELWNCQESCIRLEDIFDGSSGFLIANNSIKNSQNCISIIAPLGSTKDMEIRNNLVFSEMCPDFVFNGMDPTKIADCRIDHNWRQVPRPAPDAPQAKEWLQSESDTIQNLIDVLSLDPQDRDFLRPAGNSPLRTAGAGGDLPAFVGAVVPDGAELWNWTKSWDARTKPEETATSKKP